MSASNPPLNDAEASGGSSEAHYKFTVSYDGTSFKGFQRQTAGVRTVQGELEKAFRSVGWTGTAIRGAGRTDSGVHASGQVISARLCWNHPPAALVGALNVSLPPEIAIQDAERVRSDFDPRRDAVSRTYRYRILIHPIRQPLSERNGWRLSAVPDFEKLRETGAVFLGTHDFASFGSAPEKGGSTVRRIYRSRWLRSAETPEKLFFYEVEANGFLYRMVRRLVYLQAMAALGFLPGDSLREALESGRPLRAGLAPAAGLTLTNVSYPAWIYDSDETGKQAEIF